MRSVRFFVAAAIPLVLACSLSAQSETIAERLGYPADAKLLIIHADDLAVAHSQDMASFDALDKNAITSASVMVPCPWLTEVADYFKAHPNTDLGLHLTLTSEWKTYRWGPVAPSDRVLSLLDPTGRFWTVEEQAGAHDKPEEAEREIRAQIDRAMAVGIRPTHLDSHMGALFTTADLFAVYVKVAHDYHLPFLATKAPDERGKFLSALSEKDLVLDSRVIANPSIPPDRWKDFYLNAIKNLKPGITQMVVHLGHDDVEMQAIMVDHPDYGSAWRQRDYDVVTSPEFQQALQQNHIILVQWKDLQKLIE